MVKMLDFLLGKAFFFLMYYTNIVPVATTNNEVLIFSQPSQCKNDEYFDTALLSCIRCDASKNLIPSIDRLRCICNQFSKKIGFTDGYPICILCSINATVTIDGNDCVSCNNTLCQCGPNEIQLDRNLNGTLLESMYCLSCPNNTYPSLDGSKCISCKTLEYNYHRSNVHLMNYCYAVVNQYCSHKYDSLSKKYPKDMYQVLFQSQVIDSYYFRCELQLALYFCQKKDNQACEHLSNMCVLSLYASSICKLLMESQKSPVWLYYSKNETMAVLNSKLITQEYSLMKYNNANVLNFTVAAFSLRGDFKFLGVPNMPCNLLNHLEFGTSFKKKCKVRVADLVQAKVEFMTPFLSFMRNNNSLLCALPIFIKNINQNSNIISDSQLVRKFFIVDNISGFKTLTNVTTGKVEKAAKLSVLRYMKSLSIMIDIQNTNGKKIFPPLIIIEYAELTREQIDKFLEVTLHFKVNFAIRENKIDLNLRIIVGIFLGLALILPGIRTWNYSKQQHIPISNMYVIIWFFVYAVSTVGTIIIAYLVCLCLYFFMFCKGQALPYIFLSEDISVETIKMFTTIAFFFKFIELLGFVCQYWNVDIFLIDWEQPKNMYNNHIGFECNSPSVVMTKFLRKERKNKYSQKSSRMLTIKRYDGSVSTTQSIPNIAMNEYNDIHTLPISIWRMYFIANQWLNLQTKRKINIMVQFLGVLCVYQIIQVCPWFLTMPDSLRKISEENYNFSSYYTMCILIYVLIYCIQWLTCTVIYERCITNEMQIFTDLCSITNISVLILPFNYYGFYIHGRSVHGFADIDLPTLIHNLQREKDNLCAHRGLVSGTSQQTFILSLTKSFRDTLDGDFKLSSLKRNNCGEIYFPPSINWKKVFDTQMELRQFLCNFIDHCIETEDYIIKDQNLLQKLFNGTFSNTIKKSIFYIDNNYSFNHALLYGNEWLVATFEISIFAFIIVLCEDCMLASVITALISTLLAMLVKHRGKQNLNNNTLLDKTFLTT